jgi:hypothetical protein
MAKNCGHSGKCGCKDSALTTPPPCNETGDCAGENCTETFCDECIAHCEEDLVVEIGTEDIDVPKGTRINEIWQRLAIGITSGECAAKAAVGIKASSITGNSVVINWVPGTASSYQVAYVSQDSASQGTSPALSNSVTSYTLTGLASGETYLVNMVPAGFESCPVIKIKFKTLEV